MRRARRALAAAALLCASCADAPRDARVDSARVDSPDVGGPADSTALVVTRATVVAYLVLADGAVDSLPDVAVLADDWSYAMASLGDSVEARGFAFTMWTRRQLIVRRPGVARADTLTLGDAGYVLVPATGAPCVGRIPVNPERVLGAATRFFGDGRCTLPSGVSEASQ